MKQVKYPNLEGYLKIVDCKRGTDVNNKELGISLDLEFSLWNFSKLQNEEKVSLQATVSHGRFEYPISSPFPADRYTMGRHQFNLPQFVDVLRYGQPNTRQESIFVADEVLSSVSSISLRMVFGGRISPAKLSSYMIAVDEETVSQSLNMNNQHAKIYNKMIEVVNENILLADRDNKLGSTKENQLKRYLGR